MIIQLSNNDHHTALGGEHQSKHGVESKILLAEVGRCQLVMVRLYFPALISKLIANTGHLVQQILKHTIQTTSRDRLGMGDDLWSGVAHRSSQYKPG